MSTEQIDLICKKYRIENYTINGDGSIDVDGDVNLKGRSLKKIPIKFRKVSGGFNCSNNQLVSLEGSPESVGYFNCSYNFLTSLEFAPINVDSSFWCNHNELTTLEGLPILNYSTKCLYCWNNPIYKMNFLNSRNDDERISNSKKLYTTYLRDIKLSGILGI